MQRAEKTIMFQYLPFVLDIEFCTICVEWKLWQFKHGSIWVWLDDIVFNCSSYMLYCIKVICINPLKWLCKLYFVTSWEHPWHLEEDAIVVLVTWVTRGQESVPWFGSTRWRHGLSQSETRCSRTYIRHFHWRKIHHRLNVVIILMRVQDSVFDTEVVGIYKTTWLTNSKSWLFKMAKDLIDICLVQTFFILFC